VEADMNQINTIELIEQLKRLEGYFVEASLNDGLLNATHILRFGGRKIFDIGIDSRESTWKPEEFADFYPRANWRLDQIIHPDFLSHSH
jgi:hypothetical protein